MHVIESDRPEVPTSSKARLFYAVMALAILFVGAILINNVYRTMRPALPEGAVTISQSVLEARYGLRVNLLAVTAAGGLIDVRLKIVDGDKARLLLQDTKNLPTLLVRGSNIVLNVPEDAKPQEITFENNGNLFLLFPNAGNAVVPGTFVTLVFGNIAIDPIESR